MGGPWGRPRSTDRHQIGSAASVAAAPGAPRTGCQVGRWGIGAWLRIPRRSGTAWQHVAAKTNSNPPQPLFPAPNPHNQAAKWRVMGESGSGRHANASAPTLPPSVGARGTKWQKEPMPRPPPIPRPTQSADIGARDIRSQAHFRRALGFSRKRLRHFLGSPGGGSEPGTVHPPWRSLSWGDGSSDLPCV